MIKLSKEEINVLGRLVLEKKAVSDYVEELNAIDRKLHAMLEEIENPKKMFWGRELNREELRSHRLSYATLASQFDCVLCNEISSADESLWDNVHCGECETYYHDGEEITREEYEKLEEEGCENIESRYKDIFQFYIVSENATWYLEQCGELVLYSPLIDSYVWCIDHYGTSWDYVMTSIKLNEDNNEIVSWK